MTTADRAPTHAYVVLLRTVNVGPITVRPAPLKAAITGIEGVHSAKTIQTHGNVAVTASLSGVELRSAVEEALREAFGYKDQVMVMTREHVAELLAVLPYPTNSDTMHSYITTATNPAVLDEVEAEASRGGVAAEVEGGATGSVAAETPQAGSVEFTRLAPNVLAWTARVGGATVSPMGALLATPKYRESTITRSVRVLARLLDIP